MMTKIINKLIFLCALCMASVSCSQDNDATPQGAEGKVCLAFRVVDAVQTRAVTEDGWNGDWNENKIERVDVFLFNEDGSLHKHIVKEGLNVDATAYQELDSELTYSELINGSYTYYMVANCVSLADFNGNLSSLQEHTTSNLICNQKQSSFVLDGQGTLNVNDKTATLTFDLSRAAAKIRVSVVNTSNTSIISSCAYRLFNYVETGTSVLAAQEKYGATTRKSMDQDMEAEYALIYNEEKVVFYSYPNDWFDTSKLGGSDGAWTIKDFVTEDPIETKNQTYILLRAPFNSTDYYYKVPVNKTIYEGNDAVSFTNKELEEIRDLYRIKRNYIYDITVTIDREGGPVTDPVTPAFYVLINDWIQGGDYNIGAGEFE